MRYRIKKKGAKMCEKFAEHDWAEKWAGQIGMGWEVEFTLI